MQLGKKVDFDLESTPLYVKTDSVTGSGDELRVKLFDYTGEGLAAGGVFLIFSSPPTYSLWYCLTGANFPNDLPSTTDKVWRITLTRHSGIRLVIHCNDVSVLNLLLSDSECSNSGWYTYWSKDVEKIEFSLDDTASDFYSSKPPLTPGS